MFEPILDIVLKIGSFLGKKPRFDITDMYITLNGSWLICNFKVWNGKTRSKRLWSSDASGVTINVIPKTYEGRILVDSASNDPAGIIPVGSFYQSKNPHRMKISEKVEYVWVRVSCREAKMRKKFRVNDYVK